MREIPHLEPNATQLSQYVTNWPAYLHSKQMIKALKASDTNGFGLATVVWTRIWTGTPPTPHQILAKKGAHGGLGATRRRIQDFTNLCQKSWDALQAAGGAL
jgi:hypothetical protein